ncbi:hypothetical protein [Planococcus halocryophilus]|uniref:hypothetical protein n=1 Tax=Planococcus halocryophilus TaxID=1215089 RepID=UPI001F0F43E0|nr:hypothetical protein [Planococcus halocryophilus]MCH4827241.1 hypothetical protein [Planococcus halocryophilus]
MRTKSRGKLSRSCFFIWYIEIYASLLVVALAAIIYFVWSLIDRKREETFYRDYDKNRKHP